MEEFLTTEEAYIKDLEYIISVSCSYIMIMMHLFPIILTPAAIYSTI
jgi:hypothetical protein